MMSALGSRRPVHHGDPFLHDYASPKSGSASIASTGSVPVPSVASPQAEEPVTGIPLPKGHELAAVPGLTDALGVAQPASNPLAIVGAEHQPGEQVPDLNSADRQLTRLQAAMAFDRRQLQKENAQASADGSMRDRVDRLMSQAQSDMKEGRIAAALKTAQQAESLATEIGLTFDDDSQQPTVLVQELREKLSSDIKDPTEIPPEKSVESPTSAPASGPALFGGQDEPAGTTATESEADGGEPAGRIRLSGTTAAPFPGETTEVAEAKPEVEDLPPSPEAVDGDALSLNSPTGPRERDTMIATVVGPTSALDGTGRGPQFDELVPPPGDAEERYAALEPANPFWPGRGGEPGDATPSEVSPTVPARLGLPELIDESEDSDEETLPTATRNVTWKESPEAILRINLKRLPKPLLAGLFVGSVWLAGFLVVRVLGWMKTLRRTVGL